MKLTRNSTMFTNLNISTGQLLSTNSINKLNGIFNLFSGISPDFSLYGNNTICICKFLIRYYINRVFIRYTKSIRTNSMWT